MYIWYHRFGGAVNRNWLKTSRLSAFKGSNPLTDTNVWLAESGYATVLKTVVEKSIGVRIPNRTPLGVDVMEASETWNLHNWVRFPDTHP